MSRAFLTPIGAVPLSSNPASGTAGDIYYNSGDGTLRYYNGSSWTIVSTSSGATMSTTAPSNPTNGQIWVDTDSDVVSADPIGKSIIDAKGDLIVGSAADTVVRVAVGSPGQILYADSSTASGVRWDAAPVSEEAVPFAQSVMGVY